MNIIIREAKIEEIRVLQSLHSGLHEDNKKYDTYLDLSWPRDARGEKYFKKLLKGRKSVVFLAERNGESVGYLAGGEKEMSYRTVKVCEIYSMVVDFHHQSQGIGERLINEFIVWAKNNSYQTIYVNAYIQNERAINFYKKQGFSPIDISLEYALD